METLPDEVLRLILRRAHSAYYVCEKWDLYLREENGESHFALAVCALLRLAVVRGEWDGYARLLRRESIQLFWAQAPVRDETPIYYQRNTPYECCVDGPGEYEYSSGELVRRRLGVTRIRLAECRVDGPPLSDGTAGLVSSGLLRLHDDLVTGASDLLDLPTALGSLNSGTPLQLIWAGLPSEYGASPPFAEGADWDEDAVTVLNSGGFNDPSFAEAAALINPHVDPRVVPAAFVGLADFARGESGAAPAWAAEFGDGAGGLADEIEAAGLYARFRGQPKNGLAGGRALAALESSDGVDEDDPVIAERLSVERATPAKRMVDETRGSDLSTAWWLHDWRSAEIGDQLRELAAEGYFDDSDEEGVTDGPGGRGCRHPARARLGSLRGKGGAQTPQTPREHLSSGCRRPASPRPTVGRGGQCATPGRRPRVRRTPGGRPRRGGRCATAAPPAGSRIRSRTRAQSRVPPAGGRTA
jgi:hypothetical protein